MNLIFKSFVHFLCPNWHLGWRMVFVCIWCCCSSLFFSMHFSSSFITNGLRAHNGESAFWILSSIVLHAQRPNAIYIIFNQNMTRNLCKVEISCLPNADVVDVAVAVPLISRIRRTSYKIIMSTHMLPCHNCSTLFQYRMRIGQPNNPTHFLLRKYASATSFISLCLSLICTCVTFSFCFSVSMIMLNGIGRHHRHYRLASSFSYMFVVVVFSC